MNDNRIEELITVLYDMIQDARTVPLSADKCMIERDKALDLLDEISGQMPEEFRQARAIVESRNELVGQARHEAEGIVRQAQAQARAMVTKEAIYEETKHQCEEMVRQAQARIRELKQVSNDYVDDSLRRTEEAIAQALNEIRETRTRFRTVTSGEAKAAPAAPVAPAQQADANAQSFNVSID